MSFDLFDIDGVPVVASSEAQAEYFAMTGFEARQPGDPGIQADHVEPEACEESNCGQPARPAGRCHYHDPEGNYQRNRQERKAA